MEAVAGSPGRPARRVGRPADLFQPLVTSVLRLPGDEVAVAFRLAGDEIAVAFPPIDVVSGSAGASGNGLSALSKSEQRNLARVNFAALQRIAPRISQPAWLVNAGATSVG
jgi:hypothetical protein